MPQFGLPLRRRVRKLVGIYADRAVQLIGGHPYVAGLAGTLIALAMASLIGSILYLGRTDALARARDSAASLVAIMTGDLEPLCAKACCSTVSPPPATSAAPTWST